MTARARTIAPNARPRRYASRRLLKRDMLPPGKQRLKTGGRASGRADAPVIDSGEPRLSAFGRARRSASEHAAVAPGGKGDRRGPAFGRVALGERELRDEPLELLGGAGQLLRRRGDLLRGGARLLGRGGDLLRGGRRLLGRRDALAHVGLDLLRARRDLLDRRGDLVDARAHVLHGLAEREERRAGLLDRRDAVLGLAGAVFDDVDGLRRLGLDLADEPGDRAGRRLALLGQLADLLGDHGEAAALLARPRGLDGRIQRQQVRLLGDAGDRGDDALDLLGLGAELADGLGRVQRAVTHRAHRLRRLRDRAGALLGHATRGDGDLRRLLRVLRAGGARRGDLLGRDLGLLHRADLALGALRDLAHGRGDLADGATGLLGGGRHLLRGGRQGLRRRRHVADERPELRAGVVVAADGLDHLRLDVVEGAADVTDLVAGGVLDLRRLRRDRLGQVAVGHRLDGVGQAVDADVAEHLKALDDDLERADDGRDDQERETDGHQLGDDRGDDDRLAAARGRRLRSGLRLAALLAGGRDERLGGLRHRVSGRDDGPGVIVARAVTLLDVADGLVARTADGRVHGRLELVARSLQTTDEGAGRRLAVGRLQALEVGVAGLRDGSDLRGDLVLHGELAVVDVEVARDQVRRALHAVLDG